MQKKILQYICDDGAKSEYRFDSIGEFLGHFLDDKYNGDGALRNKPKLTDDLEKELNKWGFKSLK